MIKIDSIVINIKPIRNVINNSVGIIKAINSECAMVLFVGKNKILRVKFAELETIDTNQTGKGYSRKICNICHIIKKTD